MALIRDNYDGAQSRRRRGDDGRYMEGDGGGYARRNAYNAYNEYGAARQEYGMEMDDEMYDSTEARRMGFARRSAYDMNDNDLRRKNAGTERGQFAEQGEHKRYPMVGMGIGAQGNVMQMRQMMQGMQGKGKVQPLTREKAEEWVESMQGKGNKPGETWTFEEIEKLAEKHDIPEKKLVDYYAVMNMLASDYYEVAEKFDVLNDDFFVCMAKAFIEDKDAVKDKTAAYYQYIAKKE